MRIADILRENMNTDWLHGDLYHGTALGKNPKRRIDPKRVIYLTPDRKTAEEFARMDQINGDEDLPRVIRCRIAAKSPIVIDNVLMQDLHLPEHQPLVEELRAEGHDCAVYQGAQEVCVLDTRTIKVLDVEVLPDPNA